MKKLTALLLTLLVLITFSLYVSKSYKSSLNLSGSPSGTGWIMSRIESLIAEKENSTLIDNGESYTFNGQVDGKEKEVDAVRELSDSLTEKLNSDEEKLAAIYDWVTSNISYNLDKAENLRSYDSGALFALRTGSAVCHDYAELTKELLNAAGIEAEYVSGEVIIDSERRELHAWNEALVGNNRYALDTTWGAGFITEDRSNFIQRPRRIYLTTPEELHKLHSDPRYKQIREEEYFKKAAIDQPSGIEPALEALLFEIYTSEREKTVLPDLGYEDELIGTARLYAAKYAESVCISEEPDLDALIEELRVVSDRLQLRSAAISVMVQWLLQIEDKDSLEQIITVDRGSPLFEPRWRSAVIGAAKKGDLYVAVTIYVE